MPEQIEAFWGQIEACYLADVGEAARESLLTAYEGNQRAITLFLWQHAGERPPLAAEIRVFDALDPIKESMTLCIKKVRGITEIFLVQQPGEYEKLPTFDELLFWERSR